LLILVCTYMYRKSIALSFTLLSILIIFTGGNYVINGKGIIGKQIDQVERGIFFQARVKIWRGAILAWNQYPAFGVGIKNYEKISLDKLLDWCNEENDACNADDFQPYAHGHSLYINTLAERGLYGLLIVVINILMLLFLVYKYRPNDDDEHYKMLWTAAFSVLFLNLVIGIFNTSLHHEHALLSMIVIGLWLGKIHTRIQ
ncbi:MAG: O-antigen ligase family protein, partial [Gammaproteobacteria bacterium]|nr:O-antigen ligase family protein [Gammaproteobacteria bacterium]